MNIKNPILKFTGVNDGSDRGGQNSRLAKGLQRAWNAIENFVTGEGSANLDIANQKEVIDYENTWNEYWWNKKNAYDSTEQQLNRWMEAGGNPNAFFGGQNVEGAASMSSGSGGSIGSTIGLPTQAATLAIDGIKSYWDAKKTKAEAEGQEIQNGTLQQLNETTIQEIKSKIDLNVKEGILKDWEAKQVMELLPGLKEKNTAEIEQIRETCNNLIAEHEEIIARTKNLKEQTNKTLEETLKLKWERVFRDDFGIDPTSNAGSMIIQNILSGKGENIITALFNYIDQTTNQATDNLLSLLDTPQGKRYYEGVKSSIFARSNLPISIMEIRKRKKNRLHGSGSQW